MRHASFLSGLFFDPEDESDITSETHVNRLYGVTSQKAELFISTPARASDPPCSTVRSSSQRLLLCARPRLHCVLFAVLSMQLHPQLARRKMAII
jgi:hypothetical protein